MKEDINFTTQLRKGLMEFCFLIILSRRKMYPSELIAALRRNGMDVKEASVYTVLSRLTKEGKVAYEWQESTQGPPRKYFIATPYGKECMEKMSRVWSELVLTIASLQAPDASSFERINNQ